MSSTFRYIINFSAYIPCHNLMFECKLLLFFVLKIPTTSFIICNTIYIYHINSVYYTQYSYFLFLYVNLIFCTNRFIEHLVRLRTSKIHYANFTRFYFKFFTTYDLVRLGSKAVLFY